MRLSFGCWSITKMTKEVEKLRELTEKLPAFPGRIKTHIHWYEYENGVEFEMEEGTCYAFPVFYSPHVGVHQWFNSKGKMKCHSHKETEVIAVYQGEIHLDFSECPQFAQHECQNKKLTLKAGDYVLILPNCVHSATFPIDTHYLTVMIPASEDYPHGK
jgi:quercetin dioxygenase-like cupin family protein